MSVSESRLMGESRPTGEPRPNTLPEGVSREVATGTVHSQPERYRDSPHPTEVEPYRPGVLEKLYLPLLGGMMVTMKHFVQNLFKTRKSYTVEYPEERRAYSHRYRGHHILTTRPDGSVRCVACYLCAQACPAECIHIEAGEHPDENIEKYPLVYEIDMLRCVFCGYCVDACPEEAIIMSNNYDMAYFNRDQSIVGKRDLMKPFTLDTERLGYRPTYPEEDVKRARMRRDAFDLVQAAKARMAENEGSFQEVARETTGDADSAAEAENKQQIPAPTQETGPASPPPEGK